MSSKAVKANWQRDEMLVSSAFMTAANAGKIEGCRVEELLTRFVAELIDLESDETFVELERAATIM